MDPSARTPAMPPDAEATQRLTAQALPDDVHITEVTRHTTDLHKFSPTRYTAALLPGPGMEAPKYLTHTHADDATRRARHRQAPLQTYSKQETGLKARHASSRPSAMDSVRASSPTAGSLPVASRAFPVHATCCPSQSADHFVIQHVALQVDDLRTCHQHNMPSHLERIACHPLASTGHGLGITHHARLTCLNARGRSQ